MLPNYYQIFGLSKNATKAEIKKRYRELAKKYHPDVNSSPDATFQMQKIQEAYLILSDDEARALYDIQYDRVYGQEKKTYTESNDKKHDRSNSYNDKQQSYQFGDPILEKWILNAKRQAEEFVLNLYKDTKGVIAGGCIYYFYALFICLILFLIIVIIIRITGV
jgi:DnaJ-class molecular chaperone